MAAEELLGALVRFAEDLVECRSHVACVQNAVDVMDRCKKYERMRSAMTEGARHRGGHPSSKSEIGIHGSAGPASGRAEKQFFGRTSRKNRLKLTLELQAGAGAGRSVDSQGDPTCSFMTHEDRVGTLRSKVDHVDDNVAGFMDRSATQRLGRAVACVCVHRR